MRYGTVVKFITEKGFGFIRQDVGPDVFFHVTALGACRETPEIPVGQAVKYELESRAEVRARIGEKAGKAEVEKSRQAKMVELIDRIPGGELPATRQSRHPKARRKKPTWRR